MNKLPQEDTTNKIDKPHRASRRERLLFKLIILLVTLSVAMLYSLDLGRAQRSGNRDQQKETEIDRQINANAQLMVEQGREIFRFDTFGDEAFWGDTLKLHLAIEGAKFGGGGPGVSPKTALAVGLKVDLDALPRPLVEQIKQGKVNL